MSSAPLTPRQRINYDIRPAKSTQRKIILELLRHIQRIYDLRDYTYIGFGSYAFIDFLLFNRHLCFRNLVSIEKDEEHSLRFDFCKPLGHIEMEFGSSHEILSKRDIQEQHVIWLDYDQPPCADKMEDIKNVVLRAGLGSVLIVTMAIERFEIPSSVEKRVRDQIRRAATERRIKYLKEYSAFLDNAETLLKSRDEQIAQYVKMANRIAKDAATTRSLSESCEALQILGVTYEDATPMLTLGWWILPSATIDQAWQEVNTCVGVPDGKGVQEIRFASLTRPEKRFIEQNLGKSDLDDLLAERQIPAEEAKFYQTYYRFAPNYAELEW